VYLLHGFSGNETDWIRYGEIGFKVDKAIQEGKIPPCIIVMPDGQNSWYVNSPTYGNYEDLIIKDLMPLIEEKYGKPEKHQRAIIGLSMGGNGAFTLAMKYPDLFGSAVALSGSFWSDGYYQDRIHDVPRLFEPVYGKKPIGSALWKQNNPFYFLSDEKKDSYNSVRILFDCGDDDFVTYSQLELSNFLRKKGIKHELRIRDGKHDWTYWRNTIVHALKFCAEGFR
jgi:S-formylglutathione hydrolase FrmB